MGSVTSAAFTPSVRFFTPPDAAQPVSMAAHIARAISLISLFFIAKISSVLRFSVY